MVYVKAGAGAPALQMRLQWNWDWFADMVIAAGGTGGGDVGDEDALERIIVRIAAAVMAVPNPRR